MPRPRPARGPLILLTIPGCPAVAPAARQPARSGPAALTARRASALILGWGALEEGENEASDGRRDGRGTLEEKFHWRPVAPT
jgi:hypothetical protein